MQAERWTCKDGITVELTLAEVFNQLVDLCYALLCQRSTKHHSFIWKSPQKKMSCAVHSLHIWNAQTANYTKTSVCMCVCVEYTTLWLIHLCVWGSWKSVGSLCVLWAVWGLPRLWAGQTHPLAGLWAWWCYWGPARWTPGDAHVSDAPQRSLGWRWPAVVQGPESSLHCTRSIRGGRGESGDK